MSDRGGWIGTVAVAGLAVICCAAPLLVLGAASLGVSAWLAAHSLWLLGGTGLLLTGAAFVVAYRRRQASAACAVGKRGTLGSDVSEVPSAPNKAGDR